MSEINFNIKQRNTSFTNIPSKYLHFASNTQLQHANSQRFIRNAVDSIQDHSSRKLQRF